jgi:hypothetical protein
VTHAATLESWERVTKFDKRACLLAARQDIRREISGPCQLALSVKKKWRREGWPDFPMNECAGEEEC